MQAFAMNQQCVISWSGTHIAFSYYGGAYTRAARNTPANYIAEANSTRNLWSWNDRTCTETVAYICEFKGEGELTAPYQRLHLHGLVLTLNLRNSCLPASQAVLN